MNNKSHNFVSIDVIANKIYKNPLLKDMNFEDIIDHALSVVRIAKVPGVYVEESCVKNVVDHKAMIPKTALNIKKVYHVSGRNNIPMVMSSDSSFNQIDGRTDEKQRATLTYSVNNNMITTAARSGVIKVIFDTIKTDEDNIPMIPDSEALIMAIEAKIKFEVYSVLSDLGKISDRAVNRAETDYSWYIGKAQSEFQGFTNEDDMEGFINGWKRTFITSGEHSQDYRRESMAQKVNRI